MQESRVRPLSQEDPLEVEIATQIPFTDPSECGDTSLKTKIPLWQRGKSGL